MELDLAEHTIFFHLKVAAPGPVVKNDDAALIGILQVPK
jgi:hypothetical protein